MKSKKYSVDYFIAKFEAIPENMIGDTQSTGCAYGQCRSGRYDNGSFSPEGFALTDIMETLLPLKPSKFARFMPHEGLPARINNGEVEEYQQPTPKQRILAALYDIKAKQQPEVKERIVYVTVDAPVRELQKTELIEN